MRAKKPLQIIGEDQFFSGIRATVKEKSKSSCESGTAVLIMRGLILEHDTTDPYGDQLGEFKRATWEMCRSVIQKQPLPEFIEAMCYLLSKEARECAEEMARDYGPMRN